MKVCTALLSPSPCPALPPTPAYPTPRPVTAVYSSSPSTALILPLRTQLIYPLPAALWHAACLPPCLLAPALPAITHLLCLSTLRTLRCPFFSAEPSSCGRSGREHSWEDSPAVGQPLAGAWLTRDPPSCSMPARAQAHPPYPSCLPLRCRGLKAAHVCVLRHPFSPVPARLLVTPCPSLHLLAPRCGYARVLTLCGPSLPAPLPLPPVRLPPGLIDCFKPPTPTLPSAHFVSPLPCSRAPVPLCLVGPRSTSPAPRVSLPACQLACVCAACTLP